MVGFLATIFLGCWLGGVFCWSQVLRNRLPGKPWWGRLSGEDLTDEGRRWLRRFYACFAVGGGAVLLSLVLPPR
jgi:hypothetical protein